jgi:hypothetical protein
MTVLIGTLDFSLFLQRKLRLMRRSHLKLLFYVAEQVSRERLLRKGELSLCSNSPAFGSLVRFPKLHLQQSAVESSYSFLSVVLVELTAPAQQATTQLFVFCPDMNKTAGSCDTTSHNSDLRTALLY